jgi:8-oxo-dGTP pyrophosphatase MutT (NUDIX family)
VRKYLVGTSVYLLDSDGERILLLRRVRKSDFEAHRWEPVSGRAEPGEDLEGAASREAFEETRLQIVDLAPFDTFMIERRPGDFLHGVAFLAATRSGIVRLSPEHDANIWVSRLDLVKGKTPPLALGVKDTIQVLVDRWDSTVAMLRGG